MIFLVGDRETCGLGDNNVACEIALMQVDPITLLPVQEWHSYIDPQREIPEATTAIHGITNEMVADAPTLDEFIKYKLDGCFDGFDITMIAHNCPFDIKELAQVGNVTQTYCTLAGARLLVRDSLNHKLQTLREHFGYPEDDAHRAAGDVRTTRRLLGDLTRLSGRTLESLVATKDQTVHVMPYGEHKGKLMFNVPAGYLRWLLSVDIDANLRKSAEKALKLK